MSVQRVFLNQSLRTVEKPFLSRVADPLYVRQRFETAARIAFHPPFGTAQEADTLETTNGSLPATWVAPRAPGRGVILYLHGGGYVFGSPRTHSAMVARLAKAAGARACLPAYRLAPEFPFPAAVEDAVLAYRALLARDIDPAEIVLGGDSAGGGLAFALLAEILRAKMPAPAGLFALSPFTDLSFSGESFVTNAEAEVLLPAARAEELAEIYLAGHEPTDPRASPLFAEFAGAPPVWMCAGSTEILLDDTQRMAARLRAAGVTVETRIEDDLPHVWPIFHGFLPEARVTLNALAAWIRQRWDRPADS
jgi:acetyl esterase/lipase